ncbi:MAG: glycosyltransferase 87 family protein [Actinomycetia bacterium]|nr:glycosyltransferase 87 family protein [Actinomycetes bacterium]
MRGLRFTVVALAAWALTRCAVMFWWAFTPYGGAAATDLYRYAHFATEGASSGLFPWEYPALARMALGSSLGLDISGYATVYLLLMLTFDLAFTIWLVRPRQQKRSPAGVWLWIATVPLLGVIPYTRYDMVVACIVALAVSWSGGRPRVAALLLSVAMALKLWPLLLLPLLVMRAQPSERRRVLAAGLAPWMAFELVGYLMWGARSLTAPWAWQRERGLQIESVIVGPLRLLHPGADPIEFRFNAWETTSPGWLLAILAFVGLALVAAVLMASCRQLTQPRLPNRQADQIVASAAVLTIGILILTGKVFSPQYILWLIAPLAVSYAATKSRDVWLFALLAATCAATTYVYPVLYSQLIAGDALSWSVLQARNLLVILVVAVLVSRWRESLGMSHWRTSEPLRESEVTA